MDDKRFQHGIDVSSEKRRQDPDDDSIFRDDWLADMEEIIDELDQIFEEEEASLKAEFPDYPGCESSSRR